MWHVTEGPWNGEAAKIMYQKLGERLRATWGKKRSFKVVEDGDTKGFQSNKGKKAKADEKIESLLLPPRSPGLMPLDYSLWDEIEDRVLASKKSGMESRAAFAKRLRQTALRLPKSLVKSCLAKMKENIQATVKAKGGNADLD